MATTVKQLREFLNRFPDDCGVYVIEAAYHGSIWIDLDLDEYSGTWEFSDFRDGANSFAKPGNRLYGRSMLSLGDR